MMDATKYAPGYYPVPAGYDSWVKKDHIEKAPTWCSVDLRDGNQALIVPMSLEEKLEFFQMLVKIGFKEIEVGFPAASETEYEFLRTLIEKNMIPDDVTVQVLTQCRDHIIRRTFEAVKGAPRAVIHFYNSTSVAQREQVFHKSKEEIKQIAMDGAKLVKQLSEEYEGNFLFEYSPESFTGTEVDYAVEVCNAVLDIMQPTPDRPMIINLPVTVEMSFINAQSSRDNVIGAILDVYFDKTTQPDGSVSIAIRDPKLHCVISQYEAGYKNIRVIPYSQYTDELGAAHGEFTLSREYIESMLRSTIDEEFLTLD